jgi:hypothetical protein
MPNTPITGGQPRYRSYVLRMWEVESEGQRVWRASLQDAHSGARRGFADLAALTAFLAEQMDTASSAAAGEGESGDRICSHGNE